MIIKAILKIRPDATVSVQGDNLDTAIINWHGTTPIPKEEIQVKLNEVQAEYNALEYSRNRKEQYPSWQDQMDMQYHDKVNGTSTWQTAIAKVKSDNPKE